MKGRLRNQRENVFAKRVKTLGGTGLYFGGVAFKYQRDVPDSLLPDAAKNACPWLDVMTSSRPEMGYAASVEKAKALRPEQEPIRWRWTAV